MFFIQVKGHKKIQKSKYNRRQRNWGFHWSMLQCQKLVRNKEECGTHWSLFHCTITNIFTTGSHTDHWMLFKVSRSSESHPKSSENLSADKLDLMKKIELFGSSLRKDPIYSIDGNKPYYEGSNKFPFW